jgi:hypothetical protein
VQTEIVLEICGKNMLLQSRERENVENQKGRSQLTWIIHESRLLYMRGVDP